MGTREESRYEAEIALFVCNQGLELLSYTCCLLFPHLTLHVVVFSAQCYRDLGNASAALLWMNLASELPAVTKEVLHAGDGPVRSLQRSPCVLNGVPAVSPGPDVPGSFWALLSSGDRYPNAQSVSVTWKWRVCLRGSEPSSPSPYTAGLSWAGALAALLSTRVAWEEPPTFDSWGAVGCEAPQGLPQTPRLELLCGAIPDFACAAQHFFFFSDF